jgi:hypothetical protein|tara:strand:+ start:296 stop:820 length:525 start_codon:yes stop_codon:yes gene_type:complete
MKQFVKTGLVGIFAVGALVGCDKANFESRHDYLERKAAEKQQELFEKMPALQVAAVTTPEDFKDLKKGVYATRFVEEGDTLHYLVNVVQTTHAHKNVIVTGGEGDEKSLSERFSTLSAKDLTPVDLPAELWELSKGQYEITAEVAGDLQRCTANVSQTTHGHKNVVLSQCRPAR